MFRFFLSCSDEHVMFLRSVLYVLIYVVRGDLLAVEGQPETGLSSVEYEEDNDSYWRYAHECRKELNYSRAVFHDLRAFREMKNKIRTREGACVMRCIVQKLNLVHNNQYQTKAIIQIVQEFRSDVNLSKVPEDDIVNQFAKFVDKCLPDNYLMTPRKICVGSARLAYCMKMKLKYDLVLPLGVELLLEDFGTGYMI